MSKNVFNEEWHEAWKQEEIARRKEELLDFYKYYFEKTEDAEEFIMNVYDKTTLTNNLHLRMMNNIKRFSTMMDDVQNKEEVKLFFLITCIESLYGLASITNLVNKRMILKDFMENYLTKDDQIILTNGMKHSISDDKYINDVRVLDLNEITDLLNELRNKLVHEGVYGYFTFGDGEYPTINIINIYEGEEINQARLEIKEFKKQNGIDINLEEYKKLDKYRRTYEITITFNELKNILIMGMINFLKQHLSR